MLESHAQFRMVCLEVVDGVVHPLHERLVAAYASRTLLPGKPSEILFQVTEYPTGRLVERIDVLKLLMERFQKLPEFLLFHNTPCLDKRIADGCVLIEKGYLYNRQARLFVYGRNVSPMRKRSHSRAAERPS